MSLLVRVLVFFAGLAVLHQHCVAEDKLAKDDIKELDELVELAELKVLKRELEEDRARTDIENAIKCGLEKEREFKENKKAFANKAYKRKRRISKLYKSNDKLQELQDEGVALLAVKECLVKLTGKSLQEIGQDEILSKLWKEQTAAFTKGHMLGESTAEVRRKRDGHQSICESAPIDCENIADVNVFRTMDGTCNNKKYPTRGSMSTTQPRLLGEVYGDSANSQRVSALDSSQLPNARSISNAVFKVDKDETTLEGFNSLFSFNWGQFIDHDMVLTPTYGGEGGDSIKCCPPDNTNITCMPIIMKPDADLDISCMEFVRSIPAASCGLTGKQVINELTSFIDGTGVYGSTSSDSGKLRAKGGNFPRFLKSSTGEDGKELLPVDTDPDAVCSNEAKENEECFEAGDVRNNVQPGLAALHLLFVREHNRIVTIISTLQPTWDGDRLFQEARKIVAAQIQHITYNEYFKNLFNDGIMKKYNLNPLEKGYASNYDEEIDPSIRVGFATAAFRFGHSQIPKQLAYMDDNFSSTSEETAMENTLLTSHMLVTEAGASIKDLTRYMMMKAASKANLEIESAVRNKLFRNDLDLMSLNIQRGRDHGLPSYTEWLKFCGFPSPRKDDHGNWKGLNNLPKKSQDILKKLYKSVHDIDLYAGGMAEKRVSSTYNGATFNCILAKQFQLLKEGDRFWYERKAPEGFTVDQLAEIRKVTLSGLLCVNFDLEKAKRNALRQNGKRLRCSKIKQMDFSPWK